MICERCHKHNATVFLTQVVKGKKIEVHLCSQCAKAQEEMLYGDNPSFQQFLSGIIKGSGHKNTKEETTMLTCPKCQMTLDGFLKHSKLGCDQCYVVFKNYVHNVIKSVHGNTSHVGKRPKRLDYARSLQENIDELESRLKIALMQEEYMEAAHLRDELRKLKEEA